MQACETENEESSMQGADSCSHRALSSPSSGEILAEPSPFICSPRQSCSPNDPHFSIFYTPETGTTPIPLFLFIFHSFSSICLCVFTFLHSDAKFVLSCWLPQIFFEVCRHSLIPQEPRDQPSRLGLVVWKISTQRCFHNVLLLSFHFTRLNLTLTKCYIDSEIQMLCIWAICFGIHNTVNVEFFHQLWIQSIRDVPQEMV